MITEIKEGFAEALGLVWEVFQEFEAPEYPEAGVEMFKSFIDVKNIEEMIEKGIMRIWGYYVGDIIAGVIATRNISHISLLFVKKEFHRKGIASKLFHVFKENAVDTGCKELTVNSSPYALEFYRKMGFIDLSGEMISDGIRYIPMKILIEYNK